MNYKYKSQYKIVFLVIFLNLWKIFPQSPSVSSVNLPRGYTGKKVAAYGNNFNSVTSVSFLSDYSIQKTFTGNYMLNSVDMRPQGDIVAIADYDTIRFFSMSTGLQIYALNGHTDLIRSISFSSDGSKIASGSDDNTIKIWSMSDYSLYGTLSGHTDYIRSVAFSSDGSKIASGSDDNTIKIWDVSTFSLLRTLSGHTDWVRSVSFNSDGSKIVSASDDKNVKVWNVNDGSIVFTLSGHTAAVNSATFVGDKIVSGGNDKTIRIWDALNGNLLQTLNYVHSSAITVVKSIPGNRYVYTASSDKKIKLLDIENGDTLKTINTLSGIISLGINSTGTYLISGSQDRKCKVYRARINATSLSIHSADTISFKVPSNAKTGNLLVINNYGGALSPNSFKIENNSRPSALDTAVYFDEDNYYILSSIGIDNSNDANFSIDTLYINRMLINPINGTFDTSTFKYVPNVNNWNGIDSIRFIVSDGSSLTDTGKVIFTVNAVNDAPVADSQNVATNEDTPMSIVLRAVDVDSSNGDILSYYILQNPLHGSLNTNNLPSIIYKPDANYNGSDTIRFLVIDGGGERDTGVVSIKINAVNDAPVADSQNVATNEDTPMSIVLRAVDVDSSNVDILSYYILQNPLHGSLNTNNLPSIIYKPDANYNGSDTIRFLVIDGIGERDTGVVSIKINAVNDAPVADSQNVATQEDTPMSIVLNGSDIENTNLAYHILQNPLHGSLDTSNLPSIIYKPDANYNGSDVFRFIVVDEGGLKDTGLVSIIVNEQIDSIETIDTLVNVVEDSIKNVIIMIKNEDNRVVTYGVVKNVNRGNVLPYSPLPNVWYQPKRDSVGKDTLIYFVQQTIFGGIFQRDTGVIVFDILPVNDSPVALSNNSFVNEDVEIPFIELKATDIDNTSLTFAVVDSPKHGIYTNLSSNFVNFKYKPYENYFGYDTIPFTVSDGNLKDTGYVYIFIHSQNDLPYLSVNYDSVLKNIPKEIHLDGQDIDDSIFSFKVVKNPYGTIISFDTTTGVMIYKPYPAFVGTDSIIVKINDKKIYSTPQTFYFIVYGLYDSTKYTSFSAVYLSEPNPRNLKRDIPNGGNVRDTVYANGYALSNMVIGIAQVGADKKKYGWIEFSKNRGSYIQKMVMCDSNPRPFNIYQGKQFIGRKYNIQKKTYNNKLVAEQIVLKLNISASNYGVTPSGFGDLIFDDIFNVNGILNGKSITEIANFIDSALTYYSEYANPDYIYFDSVLHKINSAFDGNQSVLDTISKRPLKLKGYKSVGDVYFLRRDTLARSNNLVQNNIDNNLSQPSFSIYPSPFNASTFIEFNLPYSSNVTLKIYNVLGQEVATLIENEKLEEGFNSITFNAGNLSSGVYFAKLSAISNNGNIFEHTRKMLLMK